jgi:hypothetical protein
MGTEVQPGINDWDFTPTTGVWGIRADKNNGYPYLLEL